MKRKNILALALVLVFALSLAACGSEKPAETAAATAASTAPTVPPALELTDWTMSASTWSSPNGATIHITAIPNYHSDDCTAAFIVRLEGEETANVPCQWDGQQYTASIDLNAADGYCYYMVLTAADGTATEIAVNTPTNPIDESLINMESSLNSYCSVTVEQSDFADNKLNLTAGSLQIQAPKITDDGQVIACKEAALILSYNGEDIGKETVTVSETETLGFYTATLSGISFKVPQMDAAQQLTLRLDVTLTNGQTLSAPGGFWYVDEAGLLPAVG